MEESTVTRLTFLKDRLQVTKKKTEVNVMHFFLLFAIATI